MKLAFSTVACPDWPLDKVVGQASEMGYEGVELRTMGPGGSGLASDPALSGPDKVAALFERAAVEPVCLSTSLALHHHKSTELHQATVQLKRDLELASAIGCPFVRVFGNQVDPGQTRQSVIQRIAAQVKPLAQEAGRSGVQILFENAGSIVHAKEWWWLLGLVDHPMVGLCWNVANAAAAGEPPAVSVSVLNSRIRLAKIKDTKLGEGSGFVPLGEGDVGIESFIKRLMGIGYTGYLTVEWDRLWLPSLTPAEEYLPDAHQRLHAWFDAIAEWADKGQKAGEKAISRGVPKPPVQFVS